MVDWSIFNSLLSAMWRSGGFECSLDAIAALKQKKEKE
jgi:hypothetical protein